MKPDYKNTLVKKNGNTNDIIRAVMNVYNTDYNQCNELSRTLKADNVRQTCRNVFDYLVQNVRYIEDPAGVQWVKTPARLLADGTGDCKSMSVFIASCLRCLNIPHVFRFVSFDGSKIPTHVYIVAQGNIILDPVVRVNGLPRFNHEAAYTYKNDMAGTTIYKMSGLPRKNKTAENTYNVIYPDASAPMHPGLAWLYSEFDLAIETGLAATAKNDVLKAERDKAIFASLINAYNYVNGDLEAFRQMVLIVCALVKSGAYSAPDTGKKTDLNLWYNSIINRIETMYNSKVSVMQFDTALYNRIYNNFVNNPKSAAVGSIIQAGADALLANAMKKAGIYFLYTFIPDSELKYYPSAVAKKRVTQNIYIGLIDKVDIFHTRETLVNFIRSGIVARTGLQPEAYIAAVKAENKIGSLTATLITISTILSVIMGVLEIIKMIWPNSEAAKYSVSSGAGDFKKELFTPGKGTGTGTGSGTGSGTGTGTGTETAGTGSKLATILPVLFGGGLIITKLFKK